MFYGNGERYEGEFQNNVREGKGKIYKINGEVYEGIFRNDEPIEEIGAKNNNTNNAQNDLIDENSKNELDNSNKNKGLIDNSQGDLIEN